MATTRFPFNLGTQNAEPLDADYKVSGTEPEALAAYIQSSATAYRGQLLFLESDGGLYKVVDPETGAFEAVGSGGVLFEGTTSGEASTTLAAGEASAEMATGDAWAVDGRVVARDGQSVAAWRIQVLWKASTGSPPTLSMVGVPVVQQIGADSSLQDASVQLKADGIVPTLEATGAQGTTISWSAELSITALPAS